MKGPCARARMQSQRAQTTRVPLCQLFTIHSLAHPPSECFWTLETESEGADGVTHKCVAITLAKKAMGYKSWDRLLESEKLDMTVTDRVCAYVCVCAVQCTCVCIRGAPSTL